MPTERIGDLIRSDGWSKEKGKIYPCRDPEHTPPKYRVYESGRYKHTCPRCGKVTYFTVEAPDLIID